MFISRHEIISKVMTHLRDSNFNEVVDLQWNSKFKTSRQEFSKAARLFLPTTVMDWLKFLGKFKVKMTSASVPAPETVPVFTMILKLTRMATGTFNDAAFMLCFEKTNVCLTNHSIIIIWIFRCSTLFSFLNLRSL